MTKYITHKQAIFINGVMIKKYSPKEMIGIKDVGLLDSAIMRPHSSAFGEDAYPDLIMKGAALLASLSQNHAFHNANKRTAFACLYQFLYMNGYSLIADPHEAEDFTVYVVKEKPDLILITSWISEHIQER